MVQIAQSPILSERIDWALGLVEDSWEDVPDLSEDWPSMDTAQRLTYIYGWTTPREWLGQLEEWAAAMTPEQAARFEKLRRRIRELQPVLDRLFAA